jgi:peptidoglycan/LPS O-acetylase OafA/YrhL
MKTSERYAAIDILRITAASSVVAYHYLYLNQSYAAVFPIPVQTVASYGYLGVEFFFMISGYVITLSALGRTRVQFAYARFVRLWPAFVICLGITLLAKSLSGQALQTSVVLANMTMLPHIFGITYVDDVYWSLMFEIFFYAAIALLVISNGEFVRRLRGFTVMWLLIAIVGQFVKLPGVNVLLALNYAPYFSVGIAVFLVRNARHMIADWALLAVSIALAVVFAVAQSKAIGGADWAVHPNPVVCGLIVAASAPALLAGVVVRIGSRLSGVAFALGGMSYPVYLLHDSFGSLLVNWARLYSLPISILSAMIAVFAICYGVWRVEMRLRKRLMRTIQKLVSAGSATAETQDVTRAQKTSRPCEKSG